MTLSFPLLAACGSDDGKTAWEPCEQSSADITHPTGATEVVLRVTYGGGFPPPAFMPDELPTITLYGDGRVLTVDPATEGDLVPGLLETRLTEDQVQQILHDAETACLTTSEARLELPGVYDVGGVSITVNAAGRSLTTSAIGLGWDQMDANVPDAQTAHREALLETLGRLQSVVEDVGSTPVTTDRLGVFFQEADGPPTQSDWPTVTWPLSEPLAAFGTASPEAYPEVRCAIAEGRDAASILEAVEGMPSGQLPYWQDSGVWYQLDLRPMLPDEPHCAALVG
jgi:hypothetical protein